MMEGWRNGVRRGEGRGKEGRWEESGRTVGHATLEE